MGRGSYTAGDWAALRSSRSFSEKSTERQLFAQTAAHSRYSVNTIPVRESRDSEDSPEATPVIIGFDVTASMGYLARELALNAVNKTVMSLLDEKPISNPQLLCAAIGDCKSDASPLQVTQFEADIRIIRQLTELYLEGGGGGNGGESYNLLWYFAARHTAADCFEKRGGKGFLFTIGDDLCHPGLETAEIRRIFGDEVPYAQGNAELLRLVREKYHVFHIHIDTGAAGSKKALADWRELMPGCATEIHKKDIGCLAQLITAIISVAAGTPPNAALKSMDQNAAEVIARSIALIDVRPAAKKKNIISF